jgi:hypothetical protein
MRPAEHTYLFTDWEKVEDWDRIGYPVIDVDDSGIIELTKPEETGGLIGSQSASFPAKGIRVERYIDGSGNPQHLRRPGGDSACRPGLSFLHRQGAGRAHRAYRDRNPYD